MTVGQAETARGPRRRLLLAGAGAVALATAGAVLVPRGGAAAPAPAAPALATAAVVRADLISRTKVDGLLGYAGSHTVLGAGSGRVTWLPREGAALRRGDRVYGVDGRRIPLFYGPVPLWRVLRAGVSGGPDVLELERNLAALGHGKGMRADGRFDAATTLAVLRWQKSTGAERTGVVQAGDVVVAPGPLRVTQVLALPGGTAKGKILIASGTEREIQVKLPVTQQKLAVPGDRVVVELPTGRTTAGRISRVGTVARTEGERGNRPPQAGEGTRSATIPVFVTLDEPGDAGRLDGAPVTVGFSSAAQKQVLTVPVSALLAAADGSYAVDVAGPSGSARRVPVRLGLFADGRVEVSGNLEEGQRVMVPRS